MRRRLNDGESIFWPSRSRNLARARRIRNPAGRTSFTRSSSATASARSVTSRIPGTRGSSRCASRTTRSCWCDQRGGRGRPRAGRHARRGTRRPADAKQRGRKLHQHVLAAAELRDSLRHPGDDARRVRRFQSLASADGLDHRACAQALWFLTYRVEREEDIEESSPRAAKWRSAAISRSRSCSRNAWSSATRRAAIDEMDRRPSSPAFWPNAET